MQPEREPRNNARNDHHLQAPGPLGLVPQAYRDARRLYLQGRIPEALAHLEEMVLALPAIVESNSSKEGAGLVVSEVVERRAG